MITGFSLILVDDYLAVFALFHNCSSYVGIRYITGNLKSVIADCDNLVGCAV